MRLLFKCLQGHGQAVFCPVAHGARKAGHAHYRKGLVKQLKLHVDRVALPEQRDRQAFVNHRDGPALVHLFLVQVPPRQEQLLIQGVQLPIIGHYLCLRAAIRGARVGIGVMRAEDG